MPEFTGERIVPGLVDADLWNEHVARYKFAKRLARGARVLDAGCGSGYGSEELSLAAREVVGIDCSADAIEYAREHYQAPNLRFEIGSCQALTGSYDLVVAFEVIEHLPGWKNFLAEAKRALSLHGLFLVSTPNKLYYAESRGASGHNAFHVHEFEHAEFEEELRLVFPHVAMFVQNHVEGVAFAPVQGTGGAQAEVQLAKPEGPEAHFFLALCGLAELPAVDALVWIPGTGNVLREREHHIALLSGEVNLKNKWLTQSKDELDSRNREYEELLRMFRDANVRIERSNQWALSAEAEGERRGQRIVELQEEIAREQAGFTRAAAAYEAENLAMVEWARETERRLNEASRELSECVEKLDRAEQNVIERTLWAQDLQRQLEGVQFELASLRTSKWVKAGSRLRILPDRP